MNNYNIRVNEVMSHCEAHIGKCAESCKAWGFNNCDGCYFHIYSPFNWDWNEIAEIISVPEEDDYNDITVENFYTKRFNDIK